ncbi:Cell cycle checkpoint protein rad17 [Nowakowskiella sp. JEL0407]|nr:Cell cycle checkpoint protein rad17 [Nowakowskiella sp. JEL0407]
MQLTDGSLAGSRILLITGPSGSRKLSTVLYVCKQMDYRAIVRSNSNSNKSLSAKAKIGEFRSFLVSCMSNHLEFNYGRAEVKKKIIVFKDIPDLPLKLVHQLLEWFVNQGYSGRIVIVQTDNVMPFSNEEPKLDAGSLIDWISWVNQVGGLLIQFNSVRPDVIRLFLNRLRLTKQLNISNERLNEIAGRSGGDIRYAVNVLQYFRNDFDQQEVDLSNQSIFRKNAACGIDVFSKIFNGEEDINADDIVAMSGTDPAVTQAFMFENYTSIFSMLKDISEVGDYMSNAELFSVVCIEIYYLY